MKKIVDEFADAFFGFREQDAGDDALLALFDDMEESDAAAEGAESETSYVSDGEEAWWHVGEAGEQRKGSDTKDNNSGGEVDLAACRKRKYNHDKRKRGENMSRNDFIEDYDEELFKALEHVPTRAGAPYHLKEEYKNFELTERLEGTR